MEEKSRDQDRLDKLRSDAEALCAALRDLSRQHERIAARIAHLSERIARKAAQRGGFSTDNGSRPGG